MKVHNDLEELLADFALAYNEWYNDFGGKKNFDEFRKDFLSANSLALGKPEPLRKNKQTQEVLNKLQLAINKASKNWNEVKDVDKFLDDIKGNL